MVYLILAGVLLLAAALSFTAYKVMVGVGGGPIPNLKWLAVGIVAVLAVTTLGMSITIVGSRSVGIQTSFGKYRDTLNSGFQLTPPWSATEEFSTRVQYLDLDGEKDGVQVTFKGGGGGTVNATPRWRIDPDKAGDLWKKYKTFDTVRDKLVNSSAKDSIRVVTANYTPNEARSGEHLRKVSSQVQEDLAKSLADDGVIIDSISVKGITLDQRSQDSLDKIVSANNDIERAKAEQERARIDGETAKIREREGSLTGAALARYCLEVVNNWNVDRNGALPAGFTCAGGVPFTVTNK
ncbi:SPFH domain-containing protein [Streptomyces sp. NPDC058471]|uniref:SPFH domain-containing protein n=1 Tax=Streptomyces sp. NPDC058471 TaxID=3346516 RepID=UPI00364B6E02